VVIASVADAIVIVRVLGAVCAGEPLSVTLKVSEEFVAGAVGVPVIVPVEAFRLKPAGSVPVVMDHL
jgi:hypothetical protein